MSLDIGTTFTATLEIRDDNGNLTNPATKTLKVTLPGKAQTQSDISSSITNPSIGKLTANYTLANAGLHRFDWATTGPVRAQADYANARAFVSLGSLAEARAITGVQDTTKDQILRLLMGVATRHVERICGTCVIRTFTGEFIPGEYRQVLRLLHGPLVDEASVTSVTSVWTGGPAWDGTPAAGQIIVNAPAATLRLASFLPFWFGPWRATYVGGRTAIPEDLVHGREQIRWYLFVESRGLTAATDIPDLQEVAQFENTIAQMAVSGYKLSPRALQHLEGERRPGFA